MCSDDRLPVMRPFSKLGYSLGTCVDIYYLKPLFKLLFFRPLICYYYEIVAASVFA